jgi:hypothetical protein
MMMATWHGVQADRYAWYGTIESCGDDNTNTRCLCGVGHVAVLLIIQIGISSYLESNLAPTRHLGANKGYASKN